MKRTIFLIRHGEAETSASTDAQRPLTARGYRQLGNMVNQLTSHFERLDFINQRASIVASPYLRARQTAEAIRSSVNLPVFECSEITPDVPASVALDLLYQQYSAHDCLIIVSHMPLVGALLGLYLEGSEWAGRSFATGQCVQLSCSDFLPGCATEVRSFM